jgi:Bacterial Ig-like domain
MVSGARAAVPVVMGPFPGGPAQSLELAGFGSASVTRTTTLTFGASAPEVTLSQPKVRSNDTMPSFSGTASDTTLLTIDVYSGASAEGVPISTLRVQGTGGNWVSAHVSPSLPDGEYTAIAIQESSVGNLAAVSNAVTFEVDTQAPAVTLTGPSLRSNERTPSFSGSASEATPVTVQIYQGARPEGVVVATVTVQGNRGAWTSNHISPELPGGKHTYTALATQASEIGNPPGNSAPVTFVLDTEPPAVTLTALPSPSSDTTPAFSGTASEATAVSVEIFEGPKAEGPIVATATATGTGQGWSSGDVTPTLGDGTYTARATQQSAIGNEAGESAPVTFSVETSPPTVTLNALPSPTGNVTPSFSGTASDHTLITIDIYAGSHPEGAVVASATAEADGGEWRSDSASSTLHWGVYTAVATQPSSIGNPPGVSSPATFAVEPIAPAVATEAASAVTRASAAMYGSVDPVGAGVSACYFEYGTTPAYGESIECGFVSEITAFPPAGTAAVPVFARIYGLMASTTYHFRVVAIGQGGTGGGADETFTTLPPWPFGVGDASAGTASVQSGPRGSGGVAGSRIEALIARQLAPQGRAARINTLLATGVFRLLFRAPGAGRAVVHWSYLPVSRKRAGKAARPPLLVASGALTIRAAGSAVLKIHLTGAGRRLLGGSNRIRLTATCVFTPLGATALRTAATFELRR